MVDERYAATAAGKNHRAAIGYDLQHEWRRLRVVLPGNVGRGAGDGLEDRDIIADVRRWREAKSAGETGSEIAEDVAVHVGGDDDIELLRSHGELVRGVVDQDVLRSDRRILRRELLEGVLQESFGELQDVGLRRAVDGLSPLGDCKCEGELDDFFAAFARDQLETLGDTGGLHVLDPGIEIFDVLTYDDDVESATREGGLDARKLANRADVAVGLEQRAQRYICAAIAVADRRLEWTLEHDLGPLDRLNRLLRNAGDDALLECAGACFALLELDGDAGCVYDGEGGIDDFRADSIAR